MKTAIEAKFLPQYLDARGVMIDNPYATFEDRDGDRVLLGGHHRFGTGPKGEKDIRLEVGQWVTLPENGGPWFLNQCKKNGRRDIEFRIVPVVETLDDIAAAIPDVPVLDVAQYTAARAEELADVHPVIPPIPKRPIKRSGGR